MNYKIWYDEEHGVLFVKTLAMITGPDVHEIMPEMERLLEGKPNRYILGDLSDNPPGLLTKEARQAFKEYADDFKIDKAAIIGTNPATRMVTKIAISILGLSDTAKFFKTEEEALKWLKG